MTSPATERLPISEVRQDIRTIPLIDADAHITEPPDLWTARVSKKWGDQTPRIATVQRKGGIVGNAGEGLAWVMGDAVISGAPAGATGHDELDIHPPSKPERWEDVMPASYDAKARLRWMTDAGIYAQAIYPNVAGFGAQKFHKIPNAEFKADLVRAYNDFLHEWASPAPERFILNMALPFWDVQESVKELHRCADMGFRGVLFASRPNVHGLPWVAERHWDPLWEAADARKLAINFHIGTGETEDAYPPWPGMSRSVHFATACSLMFVANATALVELTMSGVLNRYPTLNFVSVESGVGFLPFVMEALDHEWLACKGWKENPEFGEHPSELFKRQIYSCFWFEKAGIKHLLPYMPETRVMFETDFPHSTKLHPATKIEDTLADSMEGLTKETRRLVLAENAARLYHIDLPKDDAWRTAPI